MKIPAIRISPREKKVLIIGGVLAIIILSYQLFEWYSGFKASINEFSDAKRVILEKQISKISEKGLLMKKSESVNAQIKELEKGLLSGNKPPVAAAELLRLLKDMALSLNIETKSERILNPVDAGPYMGIPVEIGFTASTAKLKSMLHRIKTSPLLFSVSEISVRVTNINNPVDAYTTLVIKGFIKKPAATSTTADNKGKKTAATLFHEVSSVS
ncbi:MAG: hypothetical protein HZC11_06870 [Nitrospirae bacterium]|nr:hypothetical protein [Nitrospirota bacterium]